MPQEPGSKPTGPTSEFYINKGPITLEGRKLAVRKESEAVFEAYNRKSGDRFWSPYDLPENEMAQLGDRLQDDTVTLIKGFMGVEGFIGDFVRSGLEEFQTRRQRNQHIQWGHEEWRHEVGLARILIASGRMTEDEVDEYNNSHDKNQWSPTQHPGVNDPLGALAYSTFQELDTHGNYQRLREKVRREYGINPVVTPDERARKMEYGASGALKLIDRDEIAHFGLFLPQLLISARYFPDETAAKVSEVKEGFAMPALRILPESRPFILAVLRAGIDNKEIREAKVFKPVLQALSTQQPIGE